MSEKQVPFFTVAPSLMKEIPVAINDAKAKARSIENTAATFIPLTDNLEVTKLLSMVETDAQALASNLSKLYRLIARDLMRTE